MNNRSTESQIKICDYFSLDYDNITNMIDKHGFRAYKWYLLIETMISEKGYLVLNNELSEELSIPYTLLKSIVCDYGLFYLKYRNIYSYNANQDGVPEPFKEHIELISARLELIPIISNELKSNSELYPLIKSCYNSFLSYSIYTRYKNPTSTLTDEIEEYLIMKEEALV